MRPLQKGVLEENADMEEYTMCVYSPLVLRRRALVAVSSSYYIGFSTQRNIEKGWVLKCHSKIDFRRKAGTIPFKFKE